MRSHLAAPVAALAALLTLVGCRDEPTGPKAGMLTVNLTLPSTDDRAIVISVSGPGEVGAVEAAGAGYLVHSRATGGSFRAAVFGSLRSGPLVRFAVPDVRKVNDYTALVLEIADSTNALRPIATPTLSITP